MWVTYCMFVLTDFGEVTVLFAIWERFAYDLFALFKFAAFDYYIFLLKCCILHGCRRPPNSFSYVVSKVFSLDWSSHGNQVFRHSSPRAYLAGCKSLLSGRGLGWRQWNPSRVPNNNNCHERSKELIWSRNCLQEDEHCFYFFYSLALLQEWDEWWRIKKSSQDARV